MKSSNLEELTTDQLIQEFSRLAREMGAAALDSETDRFNRMFAKMEAIDRQLRSRGRAARMALSVLLDSDYRFVRYYAATYLLGLIPDRARAELEWNRKYWFDALAGDAGMTLYNLDTGFYKPD